MKFMICLIAFFIPILSSYFVALAGGIRWGTTDMGYIIFCGVAFGFITLAASIEFYSASFDEMAKKELDTLAKFIKEMFR